MRPEIIHIEETASTNSLIKELNRENILTDGTVVYADFQQAGRGQRGNSWESECGKNLLFSIITHPVHIQPIEHFIISQMTALSIVQTLDEYIDRVEIKWPNDIYFRDKKLCGILIENDLQDGEILNSTIGVGLNVNQLDFKSDAPNPVSMAQITNKFFEVENLLEKIQRNFLKLYDQILIDKEQIEALYMDRLYRKSGFFRYSDQKGVEFEAKIKAVQSDGLFVLELKNREIKKFAFKEINYIL